MESVIVCYQLNVCTETVSVELLVEAYANEVWSFGASFTKID